MRLATLPILEAVSERQSRGHHQPEESGECACRNGIPVHLCVCEMMNDLPDGPTAGPIRRIELAVGKANNSGPQAVRSFRQLGQEREPRLGVWRRPSFEGSNRISQVLHKAILTWRYTATCTKVQHRGTRPNHRKPDLASVSFPKAFRRGRSRILLPGHALAPASGRVAPARR
jgi:hypothetical protein